MSCPAPENALPNSPSPPTTPTLQPSLSSPEPLFTEINIPLPTLPTLPAVSSPSTPRHRSISLSSLSFHRHDSTSSHAPHHPHSHSHSHTVESKDKRAGSLDTIKEHQTSTLRSRTQTLGALAVAPAVLMLSAELFTPGRGG